MRIVATAAAVLIAACATGAAAQDRPAAYTNAEACLEANVDAAVAASSGAAVASDGTTTFSLDPTGGLVPAAPPQDPFEGISIDPVTGDILTGDNPMGPMIVTLMDYTEATGRMMSNTPPVFLREHAARLIVQRRR